MRRFEGPSRVRDGDEGVAGRKKRMVLPRQGVIDLPPRQINDLLQKGNRKNELVARPISLPLWSQKWPVTSPKVTFTINIIRLFCSFWRF